MKRTTARPAPKPGGGRVPAVMRHFLACGPLLASSLAVMLGAGITAVSIDGEASAQSATVKQFLFTGASQDFVVPADVCAITVDAYGAAGGEGANPDGRRASGGLGGHATATIGVTPGETLRVLVGGRGNDRLGGFNGGGNGGDREEDPGGGGGGASDVRRGPYALADRLVVAGGGGGGGGDADGTDVTKFNGGPGGGLQGQAGSPSGSDPPTPAGGGGTQSAGGSAPTSFDGTAQNGTLGIGGQGGTGQSPDDSGGGGGGGYYGGGGGGGEDDSLETDGGGGGGGGSGFGPDGVVFETGVRSGNGYVEITYTPGAGGGCGCVAPGAGVMVGFARACGATLKPVEEGSKIYKTTDTAWVGGFELRPRPSGTLVVDTQARTVGEEGAGVDVVFAGVVAPFDVGALPVRVASGDLNFNQAGTIERQLFKIPLSGNAKVAWASGGSSATFEVDVEIEKFKGEFADLQGGNASGKFAAQLRNGVGFEVTAVEVKVSDLTLKPKNLATPRKLELKNLVFKLQPPNTWEAGAGMVIPFGKGKLELSGRVIVKNGRLSGGALAVGAINRPIGATPFVLQGVEGSLVLNPKWGFDLGLEATLGPAVGDAKLVKITANARAGALATANCALGPNPVEFTSKANIPELVQAGVGSAELEGASCLYANSPVLENKLKLKFALGPEGGESLLGAEGEAKGWISPQGLNLEGGSTIRLPLLPELSGYQLVSTRGIAACAGLGFFQGGVAYGWGDPAPQAFTGCDLTQWQAPVSASVSAAGQSQVRVPAGLPFVGFSARGADAPPRIRVLGPNGERFTSPANGRSSRSGRVVFAYVPAENRTYAFVRRPVSGNWRLIGLGGDKIERVQMARGLPDPKVGARVKRVKKATLKRRLVYHVRRLPGQKVQFYERADGVARALTKATRRKRGKVVFKLQRVNDRRHTIEALVTMNGLPRKTLTVARFRAPRPR